MMTGLNNCESSPYLGSSFMRKGRITNSGCVIQTCFSKQLGLFLQGCPNSVGGENPSTREAICFTPMKWLMIWSSWMFWSHSQFNSAICEIHVGIGSITVLTAATIDPKKGSMSQGFRHLEKKYVKNNLTKILCFFD